MFSRILTVTAVTLMFSAQINAHAAIAPALGVSGNPVRADVQRPSNTSPCGNVDIAANIDKATPVVAEADGSFVVTVTDFNAGADGSRSVSLTVDAAGTGKNFIGGKVTTNGVAGPTTVGSDQVTAVLPASTKCTGGASKNLCLVSFKTTAGFGNCVIVKQDTATSIGATIVGSSTITPSTTAAAISPVAATLSAASTAAANTSTVAPSEALPRHHHHHHHKQQAGTRAARALRTGFQAREQSVKHTALNWIWE